MNINVVIRLIENHADTLAERWVEALLKEGGAEAYLKIPKTELFPFLKETFREIGTYLDQPNHPVSSQYFKEVGRKRRHEGMPLREVIWAVQLARKVVWRYCMEQGLFDSTVDAYMALDLYKQVVHFYDAAILHVIEGYAEGGV